MPYKSLECEQHSSSIPTCNSKQLINPAKFNALYNTTNKINTRTATALPLNPLSPYSPSQSLHFPIIPLIYALLFSR